MFLNKRWIDFRRNSMKWLYKEAHILRLHVDFDVALSNIFRAGFNCTTSSRVEKLTPLRMSLKYLVDVCEDEARSTRTRIATPRPAGLPARSRTVGEDCTWRLHNNKHEIREVISQQVDLKKTWPRSRVMTSRAATLKMTSFLGSVSSEKHGAARRQRNTVAQPLLLLRLKPGSLGVPRPHSQH